MEQHSNILKYKHLGIYTQNENVVYIREACHVCISEGFEALTRIRVSKATRSILASFNVINPDVLLFNEIDLSDAATKKLNVVESEDLSAYADHKEPIDWMRKIKNKLERIFIVHGEKQSLVALQKGIKETYGWDATIPQLYSNKNVLSFK